MEQKNTILKTGTGTGKTAKAETIQYRVIITAEANQNLEKALEKTKENNLMIDLSKSDIANYLFLNLNRMMTEHDYKTLRNIHFDERRVLQGLLKQFNNTTELPLEVKKMMREYYGINERDKKRPSKNSSEAVLES